ncbi:MAG: creatininase family protein [Desulfarculus sp.]|nr:creatininase family protein [Desulfarculus sp.]
MLIHEMTMTEFAEKRVTVSTGILPLGSLEEHGPHLPLGLDAMHAYALAQATALVHPCLVAPPLFYGLCRSSAQHAGTVGISGDSLRAVVYDIGLGLWRQGIHCLCLLTGHAGGTHQSSLVEAGERLLETTGLEVAVVCVLDLLDDARQLIECKGDSHAGEVETSLALHLWPELVKGGAPRAFPTFPRFRLVRDKLSHWPSGVWGDPGPASAEKGRKILEIEVKALVAVLAGLEEQARAGATPGPSV